MSRFCFCNCPAGFSADPERHAPDCPGRSGAGKARTPAPATLTASQPADSSVDFGIDGRSVRVSQEAYSIFLAREAAGREKIAALQQRLTAADEQIDLLPPRHTEQPEGKRERFEKWVMSTKHPVYGFLDGRSLARGDDRTGYADEYVQGLWVAYLEFGAAQPQGEPVAYRWRVKPDGKWSASVCKVEYDARANDDRFEAMPLYADQPEPVAVDWKRIGFDEP